MSELYHYGIPRKSGRYPYGSGDRPYQRQEKQKSKKSLAIRNVTGRDIPSNRLISRNIIDQNERITLKPGEKVQHITGVKIDRLKPGQLYVTATDYDNKLYEAFLSSMLKTKGWNPEKVDLTLKTDLRAPSSNEQRKIFSNMLSSDHSGRIVEDLSDWMVRKGKAETKEDAQNKIQNQSEMRTYMDFINSLESSSASRTWFYNELKQQGFNSVLDEHDRESWIQGKQPIIIMEILEVVGDVKINEVTTDRINQALNEWLELNQ